METNLTTTDMIMSSTSGPDSVEKAKQLDALNEAVGTKRDMEAIRRAMAEQYARMHTTYKREHAKIGRNDPCPCGSGKKYKNCCLESGKYEGFVASKK